MVIGVYVAGTPRCSRMFSAVQTMGMRRAIEQPGRERNQLIPAALSVPAWYQTISSRPEVMEFTNFLWDGRTVTMLTAISPTRQVNHYDWTSSYVRSKDDESPHTWYKVLRARVPASISVFHFFNLVVGPTWPFKSEYCFNSGAADDNHNILPPTVAWLLPVPRKQAPTSWYNLHLIKLSSAPLLPPNTINATTMLGCPEAQVVTRWCLTFRAGPEEVGAPLSGAQQILRRCQ